MNKLLKLKRWITVPEAAKYLSKIFEETVTEADIFYFALDGKLKLSVDFVNGATARHAKKVPIEETKWGIRYEPANKIFDLHESISAQYSVFQDSYENVLEKEKNIPTNIKKDYKSFCFNYKYNDGQYIEFQKPESISGIWDLSMFGAGRLDLEHRYQYLTGGPAITWVNLDGVFIENREGDHYQLLASYDDNAYSAGSKKQEEEIKAAIENKEITKEKGKKLLEEHKEQRIANKEQWNDFYPAGGLDDAEYVYVVRTTALQEFINLINEEETSKEKTIDPRERNTLLTIIAALCEHCSIDPAGSSTATDISTMTQVMGTLVDRDTIRKHLDKLPDVIQRRKR